MLFRVGCGGDVFPGVLDLSLDTEKSCRPVVAAQGSRIDARSEVLIHVLRYCEMIHVGRKMDGVCNRNSTAKAKLDVRIGFPVAFVVFVVENDGVSGTWVVLFGESCQQQRCK